MTDWGAIAEHALGTTSTPAAIAERFDVDEDEVEERLLDQNVETCPGCGWWFESGELDADAYCFDCRPTDDGDDE